ncbi:MAG: S8 family serine peptidase [bacterium]|nr:S8 family serine peptidase [bacterium]
MFSAESVRKRLVLLFLLVAVGLAFFYWWGKTQVHFSNKNVSLPMISGDEKPARQSGSDYAPNEVLAKFKKPIRFKSGMRLQAFKVGFDQVDKNSLPMAVMQLHQRYSIESIEPVFKNKVFKLPAGRSQANKAGDLIDGYAGKDRLTRLNKIYRLFFRKKLPMSRAVRLLEADADVEYAEPNYRVQAFNQPVVVNDPLFLDRKPPVESRQSGQAWFWNPDFDYQWNLKQIKLSQAWGVHQIKGNGLIKVAVLDTGIDSDHPEFKGVEVIKEYNYVDNNTTPVDDYGHGTHVAGIIGAKTNNNYGIAGVAPGVALMDYKVLDARGSGFLSYVAEAVAAATDQNAKVINMSLGGPNGGKTLDEALKYAYDHGVVLIAAVGNVHTDAKYVMPAASPYVMAVSATNPMDKRPAYSNYGNVIDVAAPGGGPSGDIVSLAAHDPLNKSSYLNKLGSAVYRPEFVRMSGTSMAAPHVAGLAALVIDAYYSRHHRYPIPEQVKNIIINGADDLGEPGMDLYYGYGRINAFKSLSEMNDNKPPIVKIIFPQESMVLGPHKYAIRGTIKGDGFESYKLAWKFDDEAKWQETGVSLVDGGRKGKENEVLGYIDFSKTLADKLAVRAKLRLQVKSDGRFYSTTENISINKRVRNGFPLDVSDIKELNKIPVIADIDGNGKKEIVYAGDEYFYIYNFKGVRQQRIRRDERKNKNDYILDIPSIGDVTADNPGKEIVGLYVKDGDVFNQYYVGVWNGQGRLLPGWPKKIGRQSTGLARAVAVLADLDQDGYDEVVYADNWRGVGGVAPMKLYAWKGDGQAVFRPIVLSSGVGSADVDGLAVGDVNGDGMPEIVVAVSTWSMGSSSQGSILVFEPDGQPLKSWPADMAFKNNSIMKMVLADVNQDGKQEIIYSNVDAKYNGKLHIIDENGDELSGWPKDINGEILDLRAVNLIGGAGSPAEVAVLIAPASLQQSDDYWAVYDAQGNVKARIKVGGRAGLIKDLSGQADMVAGDVDADYQTEMVWINWDKQKQVSYFKMISFDKQGGGYNLKNNYVFEFPSKTTKIAAADLDGDLFLDFVIGTNVIESDLWGKAMEWPAFMYSSKHNMSYLYPTKFGAAVEDVNLNGVVDRSDVVCFIVKYLQNQGRAVKLRRTGPFVYDPDKNRLFNRADVIQVIVDYLNKPLMASGGRCLPLPRL